MLGLIRAGLSYLMASPRLWRLLCQAVVPSDTNWHHYQLFPCLSHVRIPGHFLKAGWAALMFQRDRPYIISVSILLSVPKSSKIHTARFVAPLSPLFRCSDCFSWRFHHGGPLLPSTGLNILLAGSWKVSLNTFGTLVSDGHLYHLKLCKATYPLFNWQNGHKRETEVEEQLVMISVCVTSIHPFHFIPLTTNTYNDVSPVL